MSTQDDTTLVDGLSEADLALLTPEERAAISDGAEDAENQAALEKLAAGAPDDDDDDSGEGETLDANGKVVAPAPVAKPEPAPAPADTSTPQAPEPAQAAPNPAPVYTAELPSDFETKQAELKASMDALRKQFKGGDMDVDDYEAQREALDGQRVALDAMRTKAEIAQEMQQQTAARSWHDAINQTFDMAAKPEHGGIDYRKDAEKAADLDQFVKSLAGNAANNDKSMEWFLQEGHKRVKALHGIAAAPAAQAAPAAAPAARKPPAAPVTLAQVPGADGPGDVSGEFAEIDSLEGVAYEDAIKRMTPAQLDKFMRGR